VTWADERARFPVLERHAYLNAGTFGPLRRDTIDAMAELRAWEGEHGRGGRAYFDAMLARRERVRALLAAQVGVEPDRVALTESTTQGVNVVVTGLRLGPEDEVVTTDLEHFGLTGPLVASGARLRIVRLVGLRGADAADAVRAELSPRTRLIALSHVAWIDGRLLPWRELRESTGVPVLVDGAQSAGAIEVDASAADFYTVSAQKWLCGPDATGALVVRDPEGLPLRLVGYPSAQTYSIEEGTFEPKPGAARFDPVFTPASSLAGLEAALTGLPEGRFERARDLAAQFRAALLGAGCDVVTEPDQSTLVSWRAGGDTTALTASLYERGVILRELPGTGLLRVSVGWWNDETDLDRLLDGLRAAR
jgi:L-cysteine/cystine lyase